MMTGDEDWPCLEPGLLMKRTIPTAALIVMPNAGHAINLEDPAAFNHHLADFFHVVERNVGRLLGRILVQFRRPQQRSHFGPESAECHTRMS